MLSINFINRALFSLFVLLTLILNFNFIFFDEFVIELQKKIVIISLVICFFLPSIFYYFNQTKYRNTPLVEIILLFFVISNLSIFLLGKDYISKAFFWLTAEQSVNDFKIFLEIFYNPYNFLKIFYYSVLSFLIGYWLIFLWLNKKSNILLRNNNLNFNFSSNQFFFLSLSLFFIKINLFLFPELLTINIINQFKEVILIFLSFCSSYIIFESKKFMIRLISILIIFMCFVISITETGSQIGITLIFISFVINYWFLKKKIFISGILLIILNFYFFQDIKIEYRERISSYSIEMRAPLLKIAKYVDSLLIGVEGFKFRNLLKDLQYSEDKVNLQSQLGKYKLSNPELDNKNRVTTARLTMSPVALHKLINKFDMNKLDLKYGETYKSLPFFFIPRYFWSTKPASSFGIEYGLVSEITSTEYPTSINISWISESFWNFGNYFFIAMFLKGILITSLSFVILFKKKCALFYAWMSSTIPLVIAENNFSLMVSPIFFKFIFLVLILIIFKVLFFKNEKNQTIY